jgi:hypothetical protein
MDHNRSTTIKQAFSAVEIAAGGSQYSDIFPASQLAGNASIQIEVTGDGTIKLELVGSNDRSAEVADFIVPFNMSEIVTGFTKTSGPGGDGKHIYRITMNVLVDRLAIKATETGGGDTATLTGLLALQ